MEAYEYYINSLGYNFYCVIGNYLLIVYLDLITVLLFFLFSTDSAVGCDSQLMILICIICSDFFSRRYYCNIHLPHLSVILFNLLHYLPHQNCLGDR